MADEQTPLALPESGPGSFSFWQGEVKRSSDWLKTLADKRGWDANLQAYLGKSLASAPTADTITVPKDFTLVEQKKALLFFQVPEVSLTALQPGLDDAVQVFQAVVNRKLLDEVNAPALMDEVLMDVLCVSGIGVCKIGYEAEVDAVTPEILISQPMMDPAGQPIVDPMTGQPAMTKVPVANILNERYSMARIPVKRLIAPPDFHGIDWDEAPYIGQRFELDRVVAARVYGLSEEVKTSTPDPEQFRVKGDVALESPKSNERVTGYEIWYRGSRFLEDVANSECIYQLVWFEGEDAPSVHRKSPYQREENARVVGGMKGYPIHVLTLRYASDQAIPPSDCSMSRPQVEELSSGRSEMIQQRRNTKPIVGYDPARIPKDALSKIEKGDVQSFIPIAGFQGGAEPGIGEIRRAAFPRENFTFNDYIDRDINAAWAIDSNQQGQQTQTRRTATELSLVNSASQNRMERERTQVSRWFVKGVEKLASLIQLFADNEDYIEVVGPDGVKRLQTWDRTRIQGRFAFDAKPDSSLRMDAQFDRKQAMDEYQFFRKDPLINPQYLLQRTARRLNMNPAEFVAQPQPPQPPQPTLGLSVKGEDLIPFAPQYAAIYAILQATSPALAAKLPPPQMPPMLPGLPGAPPMDQQHGGLAPQMQPMSKHREQETGMLPGQGQAAAQGPVN